MKGLIRDFSIFLLIFYFLARSISGFSYGNDLKTLALGVAVFLLLDIIAKPFIKVVFLPVNIITLGLFSWLINVIILYLTVKLVTGLTVAPFWFSGYSGLGIYVAARDISLFGAYIVVSFAISILEKFIYWIID